MKQRIAGWLGPTTKPAEVAMDGVKRVILGYPGETGWRCRTGRPCRASTSKIIIKCNIVCAHGLQGPPILIMSFLRITLQWSRLCTVYRLPTLEQLATFPGVFVMATAHALTINWHQGPEPLHEGHSIPLPYTLSTTAWFSNWGKVNSQRSQVACFAQF